MEKIHGNTHVFVLSRKFLTCKHKNMRVSIDGLLSAASTLLRDGGGCCFVVEPYSCDLPAFESRVISVTAHSDMWGEYKDLFVCEVCVCVCDTDALLIISWIGDITYWQVHFSMSINPCPLFSHIG